MLRQLLQLVCVLVLLVIASCVDQIDDGPAANHQFRRRLDVIQRQGAERSVVDEERYRNQVEKYKDLKQLKKEPLFGVAENRLNALYKNYLTQGGLDLCQFNEILDASKAITKTAQKSKKKAYCRINVGTTPVYFKHLQLKLTSVFENPSFWKDNGRRGVAADLAFDLDVAVLTSGFLPAVEGRIAVAVQINFEWSNDRFQVKVERARVMRVKLKDSNLEGLSLALQTFLSHFLNRWVENEPQLYLSASSGGSIAEFITYLEHATHNLQSVEQVVDLVAQLKSIATYVHEKIVAEIDSVKKVQRPVYMLPPETETALSLDWKFGSCTGCRNGDQITLSPSALGRLRIEKDENERRITVPVRFKSTFSLRHFFPEEAVEGYFLASALVGLVMNGDRFEIRLIGLKLESVTLLNRGLKALEPVLKHAVVQYLPVVQETIQSQLTAQLQKPHLKTMLRQVHEHILRVLDVVSDQHAIAMLGKSLASLFQLKHIPALFDEDTAWPAIKSVAVENLLRKSVVAKGTKEKSLYDRMNQLITTTKSILENNYHYQPDFLPSLNNSQKKLPFRVDEISIRPAFKLEEIKIEGRSGRFMVYLPLRAQVDFQLTSKFSKKTIQGHAQAEGIIEVTLDAQAMHVEMPFFSLHSVAFDDDQFLYLSQVVRKLTNSYLPALIAEHQKGWMQSVSSTFDLLHPALVHFVTGIGDQSAFSERLSAFKNLVLQAHVGSSKDMFQEPLQSDSAVFRDLLNLPLPVFRRAMARRTSQSSQRMERTLKPIVALLAKQSSGKTSPIDFCSVVSSANRSFAKARVDQRRGDGAAKENIKTSELFLTDCRANVDFDTDLVRVRSEEDKVRVLLPLRVEMSGIAHALVFGRNERIRMTVDVWLEGTLDAEGLDVKLLHADVPFFIIDSPVLSALSKLVQPFVGARAYTAIKQNEQRITDSLRRALRPFYGLIWKMIKENRSDGDLVGLFTDFKRSFQWLHLFNYRDLFGPAAVKMRVSGDIGDIASVDYDALILALKRKQALVESSSSSDDVKNEGESLQWEGVFKKLLSAVQHQQMFSLTEYFGDQTFDLEQKSITIREFSVLPKLTVDKIYSKRLGVDERQFLIPIHFYTRFYIEDGLITTDVSGDAKVKAYLLLSITPTTIDIGIYRLIVENIRFENKHLSTLQPFLQDLINERLPAAYQNVRLPLKQLAPNLRDDFAGLLWQGLETLPGQNEIDALVAGYNDVYEAAMSYYVAERNDDAATVAVAFETENPDATMQTLLRKYYMQASQSFSFYAFERTLLNLIRYYNTESERTEIDLCKLLFLDNDKKCSFVNQGETHTFSKLQVSVEGSIASLFKNLQVTHLPSGEKVISMDLKLNFELNIEDQLLYYDLSGSGLALLPIRFVIDRFNHVTLIMDDVQFQNFDVDVVFEVFEGSVKRKLLKGFNRMDRKRFIQAMSIDSIASILRLGFDQLETSADVTMFFNAIEGIFSQLRRDLNRNEMDMLISSSRYNRVYLNHNIEVQE